MMVNPLFYGQIWKLHWWYLMIMNQAWWKCSFHHARFYDSPWMWCWASFQEGWSSRKANWCCGGAQLRKPRSNGLLIFKGWVNRCQYLWTIPLAPCQYLWTSMKYTTTLKTHRHNRHHTTYITFKGGWICIKNPAIFSSDHPGNRFLTHSHLGVRLV